MAEEDKLKPYKVLVVGTFKNPDYAEKFPIGSVLNIDPGRRSFNNKDSYIITDSEDPYMNWFITPKGLKEKCVKLPNKHSNQEQKS